MSVSVDSCTRERVSKWPGDDSIHKKSSCHWRLTAVTVAVVVVVALLLPSLFVLSSGERERERERERETMECKREDFLEESESTSWMTNESGQVKEDHQ